MADVSRCPYYFLLITFSLISLLDVEFEVVAEEVVLAARGRAFVEQAVVNALVRLFAVGHRVLLAGQERTASALLGARGVEFLDNLLLEFLGQFVVIWNMISKRNPEEAL